MDNPQPNAFATGRDPHHAAVAATTGLLQSLSREELAGVIAHELAHIKNHDTLIMTITGLVMGFAWFNKGVYWLASGGGSPAPYQRGVSDTTQIAPKNRLINVDRAFKKGMEELGVYNKDAIIVSFPDKPADAIYVCTDMDKGAWRDIYLDQYTLRELPSTGVQIDQLGFADWLRRTNYALHVGAIGNLPTKMIYFIASLICASLPMTGFYIWWGRSGFGRRKKSKPVSRTTAIRHEV